MENEKEYEARFAHHCYPQYVCEECIRNAFTIARERIDKLENIIEALQERIESLENIEYRNRKAKEWEE